MSRLPDRGNSSRGARVEHTYRDTATLRGRYRGIGQLQPSLSGRSRRRPRRLVSGALLRISNRSSHRRASSPGERRALKRALLVTLALFLAEIAGGLAARSLALLSDAAHMLTDLLALGLAGAAIRFATLPATGKRTFGYYRLEILSAMANGVLLTALAVGIVVEAWHRFAAPAPVRVGILIPVAAAGLLANLLSVRWLHRAHGGLNTRAALWHAAADGASSALVLIAAVVMALTSWWWLDSVASLLLAGVVVYGAYRLLREAVDVLLESVPRDVDIEAVRKAMLSVDGVDDVHDLHVWSLTSQVHALSGHLQVQPDQLTHTDRILGEAKQILEERFHIIHTTLQLESECCGQVVCLLGSEVGPAGPATGSR